MTYPTYPSPSPKRGALPWLIATVVVLAIALVLAVVLVVVNDDEQNDAATPVAETSTETTGATQNAPAATTTTTDKPAPQAPVAGAFVGAGGPRPAGAEPLPTYTGRYTKLLSAHLMTPTGGIACDFNAPDQDGKQGQCGVRSMNTTSSPLGTEVIGGATKGKWLFQLSGNKVGDPTGNTGTTGWMNAPSEGYQVPRVEYGKVYFFENWVMASAYNGLTVWNTETGSGVFLSNEKVETFDGPGQPGPATTTATAEEVVLGSMPSNGAGFGTSRPSEVYAGGSPTSRITNITWSSWGGDRAEGTGTGTYRVDGRVGKEQYIPATVVASNIGMCNGKRAYLSIAWYFPSKGETASAGREMKTCWDR